MIVEGIVAFCNLEQTEKFNGQDTGKYSIVINMTDEAAEVVAAEGVKLKEYKNQKQRSFKSKYPVEVLDVNDVQVSKHIPYGSTVRLLWQPGKPHPSAGVPAYLNKVKVLEYADNGHGMGDDEDF